MQELDGAPLHQSQFTGVRLASPPELTPTIEEYFKTNGFDVSHAICFSTSAPDKLNFIFELATQARKLSAVIMGLLNRNDVGPCECLIDKLASVVVSPKEDKE